MLSWCVKVKSWVVAQPDSDDFLGLETKIFRNNCFFYSSPFHRPIQFKPALYLCIKERNIIYTMAVDYGPHSQANDCVGRLALPLLS